MIQNTLIFHNACTVVPGFRVLGFRALHGFRAPKTVDGPSALNPGTTVFARKGLFTIFRA